MGSRCLVFPCIKMNLILILVSLVAFTNCEDHEGLVQQIGSHYVPITYQMHPRLNMEQGPRVKRNFTSGPVYVPTTYQMPHPRLVLEPQGPRTKRNFTSRIAPIYPIHPRLVWENPGGRTKRNFTSRLAPWIKDKQKLQNEDVRLPQHQSTNSGAKDYYCKDSYGNVIPCKGQSSFSQPDASGQTSGEPTNEVTGVVDARKPEIIKGRYAKEVNSEVPQKQWIWNPLLGWSLI